MRAKLQERASASNLNLDPKIVADTALTAIHLAFESRGLEFAAFLEGRSSDPSSERTADLREPLHAAVTKS